MCGFSNLLAFQKLLMFKPSETIVTVTVTVTVAVTVTVTVTVTMTVTVTVRPCGHYTMIHQIAGCNECTNCTLWF